MKHYDQKVKEGTKRNAAWAALSKSEKIASLDSRLGKGVGAKRQREKLK